MPELLFGLTRSPLSYPREGRKAMVLPSLAVATLPLIAFHRTTYGSSEQYLEPPEAPDALETSRWPGLSLGHARAEQATLRQPALAAAGVLT